MTAFVNNTKTVLLLGLLTGLLVGVGGLMGEQFIIPFAIFAVAMNFGAWFFSDKIAIASMRGQEVDARSGGDLYRMVDELRQGAGLPMPRVYVCPHDAPNAFATGRNPQHAAVAVTQGALSLLGREELRGVIAHELAHIKNRDTLTSTIAATIAGVLASVAQWGFFLGAGNREGGNPIAALAAMILAPIGAMIIRATISRSREYVADADGARIAGTPYGLMSALQKLDMVSRRVPLHNPNPAQNNMFIVEPLTGGRGLMNLFATHPPTEKRVAALQRLAV
ncbi:MAG TPA: M48 family metalloprotease [Phycisphaerales bacterium]|nr:M48 family metalloprotease [Phycisphaerales bacterium]